MMRRATRDREQSIAGPRPSSTGGWRLPPALTGHYAGFVADCSRFINQSSTGLATKIEL